MDNEKITYVTNNMRSLRVRCGFSQEEIAKILNVSRTTYCDYEVNPQKVKVSTFKKLANVYGCKLVDFFMENNATVSDIN